SCNAGVVENGTQRFKEFLSSGDSGGVVLARCEFFGEQLQDRGAIDLIGKHATRFGVGRNYESWNSHARRREIDSTGVCRDLWWRNVIKESTVLIVGDDEHSRVP